MMKNDVMNYALEAGNPYLLGAYAPTFKEIIAEDLEVIGEIPKDINGVYVRNGPNPKFTPIGHYHWFDGDGMLHALQIKDGKATYRNRWINTKHFKEEAKAGKTVWHGVMGNMRANKMEGRLPLKDSANTAVSFFNDKLLAGWYMCGDLYKIDPFTLETEGVEDFNGTMKSKAMAHVKVDEVKNEMVFFDYGPQPPFMTYGVVGSNGAVKHFAEIELPAPRLPHDMGITQNYSILMDLPLYHSQAALRAGKSSITFNREMPSRFAILPRYGTNEDVRWFEADPCFIYHVVNAWEEGDEIIMDTCVTINPTPQKEYSNAMEKLNAYLRLEANVKRYRFNLKTGETKEHWIDDAFTEFPLINSRFTGRKSRYSYIQHFDNSTIMRFDGVVKYDTEKDSSKTHWYGEGKFGSESPFIPAENGTGEDEGYIISFVSDERDGTSEAIILDAQNIEKAPLARIKMPQRVPLGFHACWVNGDRLFT
ncbi:MAG: carotenoid oxygenase family protein [Saprospiraceae bacterium]